MSGYQFAVRIKFVYNLCCSDNFKMQWKVIWSNEILEKEKLKSLYERLFKIFYRQPITFGRKVVMNPVCQICYDISEDVFHALMDCKAARKVWKSIDFCKDIKMMAHKDMLSVLQELTVKRKKKDLEQIIAPC